MSQKRHCDGCDTLCTGPVFQLEVFRQDGTTTTVFGLEDSVYPSRLDFCEACERAILLAMGPKLHARFPRVQEPPAVQVPDLEPPKLGDFLLAVSELGNKVPEAGR